MGIDVRDLPPAAQAQALRKLAAQQAEKADKPNKYHNEKTTVGDITFDSRKEARRYRELMYLQTAGKIEDLHLQQTFTLQESYLTAEGERIRAIRYIADFVYTRPTEPDCNGEVYQMTVVEDVKSRATRTAQYRIKKKLMQERFGITITEV